VDVERGSPRARARRAIPAHAKGTFHHGGGHCGLALVCHHHVITLSAPQLGIGPQYTGPPCATPPPVTTAEADSTVGITSNSVTVGNISILSGPVPASSRERLRRRGLFRLHQLEGRRERAPTEGGLYDDAFSGQSNESETTTAVGKDFALVGNFSLFDSYGCKVLAANRPSQMSR